MLYWNTEVSLLILRFNHSLHTLLSALCYRRPNLFSSTLTIFMYCMLIAQVSTLIYNLLDYFAFCCWFGCVWNSTCVLWRRVNFHFLVNYPFSLHLGPIEDISGFLCNIRGLFHDLNDTSNVKWQHLGRRLAGKLWSCISESCFCVLSSVLLQRWCSNYTSHTRTCSFVVEFPFTQEEFIPPSNQAKVLSFSSWASYCLQVNLFPITSGRISFYFRFYNRLAM